ncbi:MAG: hypothetical protein AAGG38_00555 [Planctomycetota bacterium]
MEAGELVQAQQTLSQIDAVSLSKEQRQTLYAALTEIDATLAESPPEPVTPAPAPAETPTPATSPAVEASSSQETLAQADAAVENDPGTAVALYTSLIEQGGETGQIAQARLADLLRELNTDTTQAKRTLDSAETDLAAGRLDRAATKFAAVSASGADLGWFDQQRIKRGTDRIAEVRASSGQVAEPEPQTASAPPSTGSDGSTAGAPALTTTPPAPVSSTTEDLFVQARQAMAQEFYRDAKQAMADGYGDIAMTLLAKAEELDPNNPEIQASLLAANNDAVAERPQLDAAVDNFNIIRQATKSAYEEAMSEARAALERGDYALASDSVARAKSEIEQRQEFFSVGEYKRMRDAATELSVQVQTAQRDAAIREFEATKKQQAEDEKKALAEARRENRNQVTALVKEARELQKEMKYEEALLLLDQALFKEPGNFTAQLLKDIIEDSLVAVTDRNLTRARRYHSAQNSLTNIEATTPYQDIISYPEDWLELSDRRIRGLDDSGGESEANRETALKLKKTVPINFEAIPLESVINYLRDTTEANIFVNWPALLQGVDVDQDAPITLQLNNVPADRALELVLQQASSQGFGGTIGYSLIDGVVTISSLEDLKLSTELEVYDIRDLLVQVPNFTDAPEFSLTDSLSNTNSGGGGGGGGGGGSIFGDEQDDDDEEEITREEIIEQITELIQETVGTIEEWDQGESSVRELNSSLIIKTTPDNHREVFALLEKLRETRAIQISVEARFLLVDSTFLDETLLDIDVAWVGDADGPLVVSPFDGSLVNSGFQPIVASQSTNDLSSAVTVASAFEPFFTGDPALSLGVSFIDDLSVNFLVESTLANQNSVSLTAPRVTFFNGQRAYVVVTQEVSFISDLEPIPDSGGFDITISITQSGVVLDVEGTISADRRYVTMTLRPSLADIVDIDDFPITQTIIIDGDDGSPPIIIDSGLAVQLPIVDITTIKATVSVPDGGTLLIGGQRLVEEAEIESGVPVLSKLPILNRLFTNTSKVETESTLLVLIKPTILIQNEREEESFPGITDRLEELAQ